MNRFQKNPLTRALKRFHRFRGTTLAAASSFYFILTVVPMVLLLVRALGFIFGDMNSALDRVFIVAKSFFPGFTTDFLVTLKDLVRTSLFGPMKLTLVNSIFLLAGSLSFVNSLWTGVYLMTQDKRYLSWHNYIRGIVLLAVSSAFVTATFLLPMIYVSCIKFLQKSSVMNFFLDFVPKTRELFLKISTIEIDQSFFLRSDLLVFFAFVAFFSFSFRWVFKGRLIWRESIMMAGCFSFTLLLMKRIFWFYLELAKQSLLSHYGHSYTLILGIIWIYLIMCVFFVMVSLGSEFLERRRGLDALAQEGYDKEQGQGESFDSGAD